ncbi:MAG: hypothetical protein J6D29_02795 [Solobacterium sp.]|nr:hypothetical protein [Solobacterium sp.]
MIQIGIVDIGSNTVVLNVYKVEEDSFKIVYHKSTPVHLIQYIHDGQLDKDGFDFCLSTLRKYSEKLNEMDVKESVAFVTEPWRALHNPNDFLDAINQLFPIKALSGEEEAMYDYLGSLTDVMDIKDGSAFDIGGGSTELITFKNQEIIEAVSIPYGCVRLKEMPVEQALTNQIIQETLRDYPRLNSIPNPTMVGIGGTCRALGLVCDALYHTGDLMPVERIETIYQNLLSQEEKTIAVMKEVVNPARQEVFLPGVNMLVSILRNFQIKNVRISKGCVREGILLEVMKDLEN